MFCTDWPAVESCSGRRHKVLVYNSVWNLFARLWCSDGAKRFVYFQNIINRSILLEEDEKKSQKKEILGGEIGSSWWRKEFLSNKDWLDNQSYLRDGWVWRSIVSEPKRAFMIGTATRHPMMEMWVQRLIESLRTDWRHPLENDIVGVVANK